MFAHELVSFFTPWTGWLLILPPGVGPGSQQAETSHLSRNGFGFRLTRFSGHGHFLTSYVSCPDEDPIRGVSR